MSLLLRYCCAHCLRADQVVVVDAARHFLSARRTMIEDVALAHAMGGTLLVPKILDRILRSDVGPTVFFMLDERSVASATIAGVTWPSSAIDLSRWGPSASSSTRSPAELRGLARHLSGAWILYIHFNDPPEVEDAVDQLVRCGGFRRSQIVPLEVDSERETWTASYHPKSYWPVLEAYAYEDVGAVVVSSDASEQDGSWRALRLGIGNWLAGFLKTGGCVLQLLFTLCDGCHLRIGGEWERRECDALVSPADQDDAPHLGLRKEEGGGGGGGGVSTKEEEEEHAREPHPVLRGVETSSSRLDGGERTFFSLGRVPRDGLVVARWSNGAPLFVERDRVLGGSVLGLNAYVISPKAWEEREDIVLVVEDSPSCREYRRRRRGMGQERRVTRSTATALSRLFCNATCVALTRTWDRRREISRGRRARGSLAYEREK